VKGFAAALVLMVAAFSQASSNASFILASGRRVTKRAANPLGTVPVLMYHRTGDKEASMIRSRAHFRGDLNRLYALGFRPVTLAEYASNRMKLPPGASPVVFTFDDSHPDQFRILPDGTIDPQCFVGMWLSFAKKHPDFPLKATFFVLPNGPFGQKKLAQKKIKMLLDWGCEIGSHAFSHHSLGKMKDREVMNELAASTNMIRGLGGDPESVAPPYGIYPDNRKLVKNFTLNNRNYSFKYAVLSGSEPNPAPTAKSFNPYRIFRIQAYEGIEGITFWLNRYDHKRRDPYVFP
jgi:peptidoglycan/xylan/chitin deacetylase (PgdA/CDA1 family)